VRAGSEHASSLASARRAALGHGARSLCAGALQALLVRRKGSCQMRGLQCTHVSLRRGYTASWDGRLAWEQSTGGTADQ
jgi:hypothetical protein